MLAHFDRDALESMFRDDPSIYARLLNSLARLSRGALDFQKYKDDVRARKEQTEAERKEAENPPGLSDATRRYLERELGLM